MYWTLFPGHSVNGVPAEQPHGACDDGIADACVSVVVDGAPVEVEACINGVSSPVDPWPDDDGTNESAGRWAPALLPGTEKNPAGAAPIFARCVWIVRTVRSF